MTCQFKLELWLKSFQFIDLDEANQLIEIKCQ